MAAGTAKLYKYFGKRLPTDTLKSFQDEAKALTDSDVEQLVKGIEDGSLTY